ncbi:MAG TPA: hypothetical protein VGQ94_07120 [Terriglobales bacterium]|nr:hypothetical protein [Terriglobales bacterium]
MRFLRSVLPAALLILGIAVLAQQSPPPLTPEQEEAVAKARQMGELMAVVKKQFGPDLQIAETSTEITVRYLHPDKKKEVGWKYLLTGDLDGDGVEDAVIVVRFKNPLAGQAQFDYKVVDPYFTYHGYGNPKVTVEFQSDDPRNNHMILVIHGAGKEGWRAETPKAKFVIVNLPFEKLSVAPLMVKKKKVMAIMAEEGDGGTSSVYWDGKKYKWTEGAGSP